MIPTLSFKVLSTNEVGEEWGGIFDNRSRIKEFKLNLMKMGTKLKDFKQNNDFKLTSQQHLNLFRDNGNFKE